MLTLEGEGRLATYADLSALSPFGFNDIVVDGRGNAYVNSGNFEFTAGPPEGSVQPGFVALVTPDGAARMVAEDIAFPNGMAVTADNRTLVVADSYRHQLLGFDIGADGGLSGRRVWADLGDAAPDGICLDAEGAAWYADVPHQHCVRVAEGGERARHGPARPRRLRLHARRDRRTAPVCGCRPLARHGWPRRRRTMGRSSAAGPGHGSRSWVARPLNRSSPDSLLRPPAR